MKSIVYELTSAQCLSQRDVILDVGQLPPGTLFAETQYSAISTGTECAAWLGKPPLRPTASIYPRLMGYCNLAKVVKVGAGVTEFREGDRILTHQSHRSGFIIPTSEVLLRVNDSEPKLLKKLTATYLYHLGFNALQQGDYRPGHHVAVVGMGTLGITTASLLVALGALPFLFTRQIESMKAIASLRASSIFHKDSFDVAQVSELSGMPGVDLVINTSNAWSDLLLSLRLCRKGATLVCLGFPGRGEAAPEFNPLDSQYFYDKQLTLKHSGYTPDLEAPPIDIRFTKKRNMSYLASLIRRGLLDPNEILSLTLPWTELAGAYQSLCERSGGSYSALLEWAV